MIKNIGIPIKIKPKQECNDKNCPFHSNIKIRGNIFNTTVVSCKTDKSAVVELTRLHYLKKYNVYEKRKTKITVHIPECIDIKKQDKVKIGECRPISKTKKFVIIDKI